MLQDDWKTDRQIATQAQSIIERHLNRHHGFGNNVLGFPFIFRGALDVRARQINDAMKFAASKALAALAKEDVPDSVLRAYGLESLKFGRDYIIPKPLDPRVMLWVSPAVAAAAMQSGVARKQINITEYREQLAERLGSGVRLRRNIINKAKAAPKRIVFPEGEEATILRAAAVIVDEAIGQPILIGRPEIIQKKVQELGLHFTPQIVDPNSDYRAPRYAQAFYELRQRRGLGVSAPEPLYVVRIDAASRTIACSKASPVLPNCSKPARTASARWPLISPVGRCRAPASSAGESRAPSTAAVDTVRRASSDRPRRGATSNARKPARSASHRSKAAGPASGGGPFIFRTSDGNASGFPFGMPSARLTCAAQGSVALEQWRSPDH